MAKPAHAHNPPNISKDKKGYNRKLFPTARAVRRALRRLGYKVMLTNTAAPAMVVRQFQRHYNHCSIKRFPKWGSLKVDGVAGKHTLNAIEIALTWSRKSARKHGGTAAHRWQKMCRRLRPPRMSPKKKGPKRKPKHGEFVEVMGKGRGKLRRPGMDYRVYINKLAKKGNLLFAQVRFPPQMGLLKGKHGLHWYPAIVRPHMPRPHHPIPKPAPGGYPPGPVPAPQPWPIPAPGGGYPKPAPGYPTPGGGGAHKPPWM